MGQARLKERKKQRAEPGQIGLAAWLKDQIHSVEPGQTVSVARLKDKIHRAEPGQIVTGQAKR